MEISDYVLIISTIIGFIALVKSFFNDRKIKQQQLEINEYKLEVIEKKKIDEKKACIRTTIVRDKNSDETKIEITNIGVHPAYNIHLDTEDIESKGIFILKEEKMPYPILNKDDSFKIDFVLSHNASTTIIVAKLIWDDGIGENQTKEQALDLDC